MTRTLVALAVTLFATSALAQDCNRQDLVRGLCQKDGCDEFTILAADRIKPTEEGTLFKTRLKTFHASHATSSHFGFLGCGGVGWLGWGRLRRCSAGRARWRPREGQGFQELGPGGEHNIGAQGLQVVEEAGSGSKRLAGVPPSA